VNLDPLSECTFYGRPTQLNICNKASATVLALISFKGTASGKRVHISIEPVSSKVNHLRGTRFEEKRKQRF